MDRAITAQDRMDRVKFKDIVAKLDKWNSDRLTTISERSTMNSSSLIESEELNEIEEGQGANGLMAASRHHKKSIICKPMASSTPLLLSPSSQQNGRYYSDTSQSELSAITKCSTLDHHKNLDHGDVSTFVH